MTDDSQSGPDPIVELQIRVAYQDKLIAELDEVVQHFASRVEQLERETKELRERLDEAPDVGPHDDKPPHY